MGGLDREGCVEGEGGVDRGVPPPPEAATDAVSTHPTGMYSCFKINFN